MSTIENSKGFFSRSSVSNEYIKENGLDFVVQNCKSRVCEHLLLERNFSDPLNLSSYQSYENYEKGVLGFFLREQRADGLIFVNEIRTKNNSDVLILDIYFIDGVQGVKGCEIYRLSDEISKLDESSWSTDLQSKSEKEKDLFLINLTNLCEAIRKVDTSRETKLETNKFDISDFDHFCSSFNRYDNRGDD